ncbi:MAG: ATP-grasp domain-containing protein [Leptospirales bacterium]|jgi:D-alanine-D-alanine ligase
MKIAFTHNLQLSDSEDEAEFDTPQTVAGIIRSLRALGHQVEPVEVSGPASRLVARLEALSPDLVFNTAEGARGRFREAFFPALFDRLGLAFTGSDAYVCALTLDKQTTKLLVAGAGVPVARGFLITQEERTRSNGDFSFPDDLRFPLMIKPNFEGSSMGITQESIVETAAELKSRLEILLERFPGGLLVEEYIVGRDVVVPWLEKASPETGGVLEPASYSYHVPEEGKADRRYEIYDYDLKNTYADAVSVQVPADITPEVRAKLMLHSRAVFRTLGMRDVARIDFRVTDAGEVYFIEVNALPSLEDGASIYKSGALAGLPSMEAVLGAVVQSAAERFELGPLLAKRSAARAKNRVRVGLTFNVRRGSPVVPETPANDEFKQGGAAKAASAANNPGAVNEEDAEHDSPETIAALRAAIESFGHEVVELEATQELPSILAGSGVDVVFNVAEGFVGRSRESQVPALLELLGIPYTGSDPTTLSLSLDKALAKRLIAEAGLVTPAFVLMVTGRERLPAGMRFPVIAKPVAEGSSKGVLEASVIESEVALRSIVRDVVQRYRQPVLVEEYLPGREFTVAMLGEKRPKVLPIMEIKFRAGAKLPIYSFANKFVEQNVSFAVPADVDAALRKELERVSKSAFTALGCRDLARIDLRLDQKGRVHFIECNPLPGLSPGFSDFCLIGEAAGLDYRTLIGEILSPALRRMREMRKEKILAERI